MSLLNKILISLLLLITLSCNLQVEQKEKETGSISISIPNISPRLLEALKEGNSRAYNIIDKLVLTVTKDGEGIPAIFEKNFKINEEEEIVLILDEGKYLIKADIFNLKNSESIAVVSGEATVDIIKDNPKRLEIILLPNNPVELEENKEVEITNLKYNYWESLHNEIVSTGEEYWYEVKTSTNITDFEITNPIEHFSPAILTVYDKRGYYLEKTNLLEQKIRIRTTPGDKYFVSVVPVKVKNDNGDFYKEKVSFKVAPMSIEPSMDNNNSIETAVNLPSNSSKISAHFDTITDADYYVLDITDAKAISFNISSINDRDFYYYSDIKMRTIVNGVKKDYTWFQVIPLTDEPIIVEVTNNTIDKGINYEISINKFQGSNDNNNSIETAEAIPSDSSFISSHIDSVLDIDYFVLNTTNSYVIFKNYNFNEENFQISIIQNEIEEIVEFGQVIDIKDESPVIKVANMNDSYDYNYEIKFLTFNDSQDDNNSVDTAENIPFGSKYISSNFDSVIDVDYFVLDVTGLNKIVFKAYDELQLSIIKNGVEEVIAHKENINLTDNSLTIKVTNKGFSTNYNYSLQVITFEESKDNNYSIKTAEAASINNGYISSNFDSVYDVDYFVLDVTGLNKIAFGYYGDYKLSIIQNEIEKEVKSNQYITITGESLILKTSNTYIDNSYKYDINFIPSEDSYETGSGDNSFSTATEIIINGELQHHTIHIEDEDFFKVDLTEGKVYTFTTSYSSGIPTWTKLVLYDQNKEFIDEKSEDNRIGSNFELIYTATDTGTYYFKIKGLYYDCSGDYSIKVTEN